MAVQNKGTMFDPEIVTDLINKVRGHSSLAKLSKRTPVAFNGNKEFIFTMDSEVDIVAESGKKTEGGVKFEPKVITPIKVEYGARISDEFIIAAEEEQIDILKAFNEGFSKKVARGLDLMAFHGINPRSGTASSVIGAKHLDAVATQTVNFDVADPEANIEAAVAMIQGSDGDVTGMAMSSAFSGALAKLKVNGVKQYPELAWGSSPESINGVAVDINRTVSDGTATKDRAIIGDFANMISWGYAKEIPLQIIEYGDPDNSGNDLKGYGQVYLRAEMYIGWGIFDENSFVRIIAA